MLIDNGIIMDLLGSKQAKKVHGIRCIIDELVVFEMVQHGTMLKVQAELHVSVKREGVSVIVKEDLVRLQTILKGN